ncbi:hypothetical protein Esti_002903 [Eimeria stiedai]
MRPLLRVSLDIFQRFRTCFCCSSSFFLDILPGLSLSRQQASQQRGKQHRPAAAVFPVLCELTPSSLCPSLRTAAARSPHSAASLPSHSTSSRRRQQQPTRGPRPASCAPGGPPFSSSCCCFSSLSFPKHVSLSPSETPLGRLSPSAFTPAAKPGCQACSSSSRAGGGGRVYVLVKKRDRPFLLPSSAAPHKSSPRGGGAACVAAAAAGSTQRQRLRRRRQEETEAHQALTERSETMNEVEDVQPGHIYQPGNKKEVRLVYRILSGPYCGRHQKSFSLTLEAALHASVQKWGPAGAWAAAREAKAFMQDTGRLPPFFASPYSRSRLTNASANGLCRGGPLEPALPLAAAGLEPAADLASSTPSSSTEPHAAAASPPPADFAAAASEAAAAANGTRGTGPKRSQRKWRRFAGADPFLPSAGPTAAAAATATAAAAAAAHEVGTPAFAMEEALLSLAKPADGALFGEAQRNSHLLPHAASLQLLALGYQQQQLQLHSAAAACVYYNPLAAAVAAATGAAPLGPQQPQTALDLAAMSLLSAAARCPTNEQQQQEQQQQQQQQLLLEQMGSCLGSSRAFLKLLGGQPSAAATTDEQQQQQQQQHQVEAAAARCFQLGGGRQQWEGALQGVGESPLAGLLERPMLQQRKAEETPAAAAAAQTVVAGSPMCPSLLGGLSNESSSQVESSVDAAFSELGVALGIAQGNAAAAAVAAAAQQLQPAGAAVGPLLATRESPEEPFKQQGDSLFLGLLGSNAKDAASLQQLLQQQLLQRQQQQQQEDMLSALSSLVSLLECMQKQQDKPAAAQQFPPVSQTKSEPPQQQQQQRGTWGPSYEGEAGCLSGSGNAEDAFRASLLRLLRGRQEQGGDFGVASAALAGGPPQQEGEGPTKGGGDLGSKDEQQKQKQAEEKLGLHAARAASSSSSSTASRSRSLSKSSFSSTTGGGPVCPSLRYSDAVGHSSSLPSSSSTSGSSSSGLGSSSSCCDGSSSSSSSSSPASCGSAASVAGPQSEETAAEELPLDEAYTTRAEAGHAAPSSCTPAAAAAGDSKAEAGAAVSPPPGCSLSAAGLLGGPFVKQQASST